MREIKFRAWNKFNEEMLKVSAIALERNCFKTSSYVIGSQPHFYDEHNDCHAIADCVLMQYTGFTDKNGVKIYEGDIVNCREYECFGRISWHEDMGAFMFDIVYEGGGFDAEWIIDYADHLEVIGNIYENPELLEVSE